MYFTFHIIDPDDQLDLIRHVLRTKNVHHEHASNTGTPQYIISILLQYLDVSTHLPMYTMNNTINHPEFKIPSSANTTTFYFPLSASFLSKFFKPQCCHEGTSLFNELRMASNQNGVHQLLHVFLPILYHQKFINLIMFVLNIWNKLSSISQARICITVIIVPALLKV